MFRKHTHQHNQPKQERTLLRAAAVNAGAGVLGLVTAMYTGSPALASDALHSVGGDSTSYFMKHLATKDGVSPNRLRKLRRGARLVLCASALGIAAQGASELIRGDYDDPGNLANVVAVGEAAVALSVARMLHGTKDHSHVHHDGWQHGATDASMAIATVVGVSLANTGYHWADPAAAVATGVLTATIMWPTNRRLTEQPE